MNQTTQATLQDYIQIIRNLTAAARQITRTEEIKTAAASEKRHELLDGCIQEEQALLLKLRGLEQHSPEQCALLAPVFQELDQQMQKLQNAREGAERVLNVRLREIKHYAQQGTSYNNGGGVNPPKSPSQGRIRSTYV